MSAADRLFQILPRNFSRQKAIKAMISRGYSVQYTDSLLATLSYSGKAQRIGRGKYVKTE